MRAMTGAGRSEAARYVAAGAAAVAAILYFLIGLKVLRIGDGSSAVMSRTILGMSVFGAMTGITFTLTAILLLAVRSRALWLLVVALQVIVIVGYVAIAGARTPPFEVWGLLVKACQVVVLAAAGYLLVRGPARAAA